MSKIPSTASKGAVPKKAGTAPKGKSAAAAARRKGKDVIEWQLPAFSVPPPKDKDIINWEKLRKDTARRQAPEGEDIKEIRRVLKEVKGIDVPVCEFITMISQYTSDNGATLRSVMAEDLKSFRALAKKVYETMTQDVSDVLVNEQLQMVQYYDEKTSNLSDRMMRAINEIYEMAPKFDFEKFLRDKDEYMLTLFPSPHGEVETLSDEACEMMKRQQAYHRLQWLRSEGERMSEENKRLMRRLEDLKQERQQEQNLAAAKVKEAEAKRRELAREEEDMKDKLDELNESIEKSFIRDERSMTRKHNRTIMQEASETTMEEGPKRGPSAGAIRKTRSGAGVKKPQARKQDWPSATAANIEEEAMKEIVAAEGAKKTPARTKKPKPKRTQPPPPKELSPFHFTPPKTPPQDFTGEDFASWGRPKPKEVAKPPSPFHFSPPKSLPRRTEGPVTSTRMGEAAFSTSGRARPATAPRQAPVGAEATQKPSRTGARKVREGAKSSIKTPTQPPPAKETSPFHFSPPKTPPQEWGQEDFASWGQKKPKKIAKPPSPFHYSPPKSPTRMQETRIEETTTTVQHKRGAGPRDSWGGFY